MDSTVWVIRDNLLIAPNFIDEQFREEIVNYQMPGCFWHYIRNNIVSNSVAEPHHFYAPPAPGENFDAAPAAPAPAVAPILLYNKAKFLKRTKVYTHVETILFIRICTIFIAENMN
jgi:hypothetical protein